MTLGRPQPQDGESDHGLKEQARSARRRLRMEEDLHKAAMTRAARLRLDPAMWEPTGSRTEQRYPRRYPPYPITLIPRVWAMGH